MTRFDILTPRPRKDGKTFWLKIGAAFEAKNGGYSIVLDALPLPDAEGRVSLLMKEPMERDGQARPAPKPPTSDDGHRYGDHRRAPMPDDEIPF